MKNILTALLILSSLFSYAQCTYTIDMQDSFGDGWNGASVSVNVNGTPFGNYTFSSGSSASFNFSVNNLDVVDFIFNSGSWDSECTYQIYVGAAQLFADGPNPLIGLAFTHQCGGCDPPAALTVSGITSTSANLGWTPGTGNTNFIVEYGPAPFTPGNGTLVSTAANPYTASGLLSGTDYYFYVQQICASSGDTSIPAGPFLFTTNCASSVAPWAENFNGTSTPNCWLESGSEAWRYSTTAGYAAGSAGDHTANGGNYAWIDGSAPNGPSQISTLTSPPIDVSGLGTALVSYWVFSHNTNDNGYNTLLVELYDGATWNTINTVNSDQGPGWVNFVTGLGSYTITGPIQIRFTITENSSGSPFYNDILIDDIEVIDAPNISLDTILGLQSFYCKTPISIDLVISNTSANTENDIPWAVSDGSNIIASGFLASLPAFATDTVNVVLGVSTPTANLDLSAYTFLITDQSPADDTIHFSTGVSYTTANLTMTQAVGCLGDSLANILADGLNGVPPYQYQWDANANNSTNISVSGLPAGNYTITVTDSLNCDAIASLNVLDPPAVLSLNDSINNILCSGQSTGYAMVQATGGFPSYSYLWSNGAITSTIENVPAGSYSVSVTDDYGCTQIQNINITEPASALNISINYSGGDSLTALATGGTAPYSYEWDFTTGFQTNATATGLSNGNYYVVVTDANGCTQVITYNLVILNNNNLQSDQVFHLFPVPANDLITFEYQMDASSDLNLTILDVSGRILQTHVINDAQIGQLQIETSDLSPGIYMMKIIYDKGYTSKRLIISK